MPKSLLVLSLATLALTACSKGVDVESPVIGTQQFQNPVKNGQVVHPTGGKEIWLAITPLSATTDQPANGVAQAHYFENNLYLITAQLNIAPAADGYFYEGWVVNGSDTVSLGHLNNIFGDTRHTVEADLQQDLREYTSVIITLEADDGNPAPSLTVANGVLKVTERPR